MNNRNLLYALALTCLLLVFGGWLLTFFHHGAAVRQSPSAQVLNSLHTGRAAEPQFNPPRPQDAPEAIRDAVILGYNILTDTAQYAPGHAGNELTCATCHLEAGRSKNSISLVGAAATYPRFSANHKGSIDLAQKVQDCFARNLNATPPALDSRDMQAILAYLQWISKDIPVYASIPWALPAALGGSHKADAVSGAQVYADACAACHGEAGDGSPPLWGKGAYTDGSSLHDINTFAVFTHRFMPPDAATLTPEEALDVSSYVNAQPRPVFSAQPAQGK
jgi:Cytochrome c